MQPLKRSTETSQKGHGLNHQVVVVVAGGGGGGGGGGDFLPLIAFAMSI